MLNKSKITEIKELLAKGRVIAYPTEAVYGLGCDPTNEIALQKILQIKNRSYLKGLILIASHWQQLEPFVYSLSDEQMAKINSTWPGPVTWLLPVKPSVSKLLCGQHQTLAVRITNHPLVREICEHIHLPLVSTSANREGQPPARSFLEVQAIFGDEIDLIIEGEVGGLEKPTEIRDGLTGAILRSG